MECLSVITITTGMPEWNRHIKAFNQTVMVADIYIQLDVNLRVTSAGYYQPAGNVNGIPVSVKHSIISGPGITRA